MPVDRPRIVGRYAIYGEIAAGGMATVHFGRLLGPVGFTRTVAIKQLYPHFARDAEFVAMFLDEARLAARIRHPNVIQTIDVVADNGELFLVMDYVESEPLSRLIRLARGMGEPIPLRIATSIVCGALHGLHAAHEATSDRGESLGIVHRDVSPQNILVGIDGVPLVIDFGVAKAIGRAHTTRDGNLKGKVSYMAPEQLEGRATRRSDIFAASVVLWETLTGERLFAADDERATIANVFSKTIEPPSKHRALPASADDITRAQLEELDAITLCGLSRSPEDRYETARAMAAAIEGCLGLASATQVGEWVQRIAGDRLRARSEEVAAIEASPPHLAGVRWSSPSRGSPPDAERTEPTTPTISASTSPSRPGSKRRGGWQIVGGSALAVILGLELLRVFGPGLTSSRAPATPSALASAPPVATVSGVPPLPSSSATEWDPSAVPSASAPASTSPSGDHVARPRVPRAKPAGPRKPNCDPPYVYDAAGHEVFKEECFRP